MKKFISTLSAIAVAATSLSAMYVSAADNAENVLSTSTTVLTESITVDGVVIPAGATAITVSISNNTGFDATTTKVELGSAYSIIESASYRPVITSGSAASDSAICAVDNDNVITVATVDSDISYNNGALYTFYVNVDNTARGGNEISVNNVVVEPTRLDNTYYHYGDLNNDGYITSADASQVDYAIDQNGGSNLYVGFADNHRDVYFYNCDHAELADPTWDNYITSDDRDEIMFYYLCESSNVDYSSVAIYHCGEIFIPQPDLK